MRTLTPHFASASIIAMLSWMSVAAPSANADVVYDYTGTPFTRCGSSPDCPIDYTSDYIVASISLAAPFAPNLPLTPELSSLTAWSIKDALGNFSFSSTDPDAAAELQNFAGCTDMSFSTDSHGNIVHWCMLATSSEFFGLTISPTVVGGSGLPIADTFLINPGMPDQENVTTSTPGTWTVTPEPSGFVLTGSGLTLLIAMRRRRRAVVPAGGTPRES